MQTWRACRFVWLINKTNYLVSYSAQNGDAQTHKNDKFARRDRFRHLSEREHKFRTARGDLRQVQYDC